MEFTHFSIFELNDMDSNIRLSYHIQGCDGYQGVDMSPEDVLDELLMEAAKSDISMRDIDDIAYIVLESERQAQVELKKESEYRGY